MKKITKKKINYLDVFCSLPEERALKILERILYGEKPHHKTDNQPRPI